VSNEKKTVFISCGQSSQLEKALGEKVVALVAEKTPFQGYFAEDQTTLEGLTRSILSRLFSSVGFIAIMHRRGTVQTLNGSLTRASVWIEQEIAIAALMQQVVGRPLHVASYVQEGIALEGVRHYIHLNSVPFRTEQDVIDDLSRRLPTWQSPLYPESAEGKKQVEGIKLTLGVVFGRHPNFTIAVTNHSKLEILVDSITLWFGDKKLSDPATPEGGPTKVRAGTSGMSITFNTSHDPFVRLGTFAAIDPRRPPFMPAQRVDIRIEVEFEALGERSRRIETVPVEVDHNRQIRPVPG
jgi:hypothetical protein